MGFKPYPIVPFATGLEEDKEPFILPDDSFPIFTDCYLYQGRIEKRMGNEYLGRLVQQVIAGALGNTGASPFVANIITAFPAATLGIEPGSVTIHIAAPVGPFDYADTDGDGILYLWGFPSGTVNYTSGDVSVTHGAGGASAVTVTFSYFTGRPCMGLLTREIDDINRENLIAFDTVKANLWNTTLRRFEDISYDTAGNVIQWSGTDSDFFWGWNYYTETGVGPRLFWATNNLPNTMAGPIVQDGIQIYNGTGWALQTPQLNATPTYLRGCLMLVSYRDRMVALNTLEGPAQPGLAIRYGNRARWSQHGTPYTNTLASADPLAWRDDIVGYGGYIPAPTAEQIVSCGFFKDTLIVFFERSTWQLSYTGDDALPFTWFRINTQFGCESTFSVVGFDKGLFAVGDKAIIASDSNNVDRIDQKIPLEVFGFHNENLGPKRVYGIRDFYYEFVYWTFPNGKNYVEQQQPVKIGGPGRWGPVDKGGTFPNRVLALNYQEHSYSFFTDSYTCFGYYQDTQDTTWHNCTFSWAAALGTWISARRQSDFPSIVAGNQQGFVMIIDQKYDNDTTLYITFITQAVQCIVVSPNHNLTRGQFVKIVLVEGMVNINNMVGKILDALDANTLRLDIDTSAFPAYVRSGYIIMVNNIDIFTKKFNPAFAEGKQIRASYADFYVERTAAGQFDVDVLIDDSYDDPIFTQTVATYQEYGPLVDVGKLWQRVYCDCKGQFLQFHIYMNDTQMKTEAITDANIVIHAATIWLGAAGRLQSYDS